jgi:hypothetical protein
MEMFSIEIGTTPGGKAPGEFLREVLSGTNIDIKDMPDRILEGNVWEWIIPESQNKQYGDIRNTIKQRLTGLYVSGKLTYASW